MQQQMNFLDSLFGKTSPEPLAAMEDGTFTPSSNPSQTSPQALFMKNWELDEEATRAYMEETENEKPIIRTDLLFLDLRRGGGNLLGAYWEMVGALPGVSMMHNTGVCPRDVRESTLSQILDLNAPEKYSLSPKAAAGILNRAKRRQKSLPPMLLDALMERVGSDGEMAAEDVEEDA